MPIPRKTVEEEIKGVCQRLQETMIDKYLASKSEVEQKQKRRAAQHEYLLAEDARLDLITRL